MPRARKALRNAAKASSCPEPCDQRTQGGVTRSGGDQSTTSKLLNARRSMMTPSPVFMRSVLWKPRIQVNILLRKQDFQGPQEVLTFIHHLQVLRNKLDGESLTGPVGTRWKASRCYNCLMLSAVTEGLGGILSVIDVLPCTLALNGDSHV